jgi:hypothetical protein
MMNREAGVNPEIELASPTDQSYVSSNSRGFKPEVHQPVISTFGVYAISLAVRIGFISKVCVLYSL